MHGNGTQKKRILLFALMISIGLKKKVIFTKMTLKFILINYRKMNGILSVVYMNKSMKIEKLVLMKQIGN